MSILRRKSVQRACVVLALVAALVVGRLYLWPDRPGAFTKANFDRVQVGMTYEEVEDILGPPTPGLIRMTDVPPLPFNGPSPSVPYWGNDTALGYVSLDPTGVGGPGSCINVGVVREKGYIRRPLAETLWLWWYRATGRPTLF
jgi:hypothetical protein